MKLSFIVCTHNRAQLIIGCIDFIRASVEHAALQTEAELVIVDNASTDNTISIIQQWSLDAPFATVCVSEPQKGLSAARNCGLRTATGDVIAFTDDDCRVSPEYAADILRHDKTDGNKLVIRSGPVLLGNPEDLPITIKPVLSKRCWQRPMSLRDEAQILGGALIGCNMTMRRAVFEKLGFFDKCLGAGTSCHAGEDTDYFYRAYLAGITLECVPDMAVHHFHGRKTVAERDKLLRNYAIGNGALSFKYLFIYPRFARHFFWATKHLLGSIFSPAKHDRPWISAFDNFRFMLAGACLYAFRRRRNVV